MTTIWRQCANIAKNRVNNTIPRSKVWHKGLIIAGTASNSGKTTTALGLISLLRKMGQTVLPAKLGPDYIDAHWLAKAAQRPCINIDQWMSKEPAKKILAQFVQPGDIIIIEAAMGLFDGAAQGGGNAVTLAKELNLPILLLLPSASMGQSIAAVAHGFLSHVPEGLTDRPEFCGIICTHTGSQRHAQILGAALEPVCKKYQVPLLGFLPKDGMPHIPARYLGLMQASENACDLGTIESWFAKNITALPVLKPHLQLQENSVKENATVRPGLVVAIARDAAFTFCYADLPLLLENMGAKVTFFSPLGDSHMPECQAVYFPGGYPELYAADLAKNHSIKASLCKLAQAEIPIYGECGGYMYLMNSITDRDGRQHEMCGLLSGNARPAKRTLGYRTAFNGIEIRGHEFHYFDHEPIAETAPMWDIWDSQNNYLGPCGQRKQNIQGSWIHLYPQGSQLFWHQWLNQAARE